MKNTYYDVVIDVLMIMKDIQEDYNLRYDWYNDYNPLEIRYLMSLAKLTTDEKEYKEIMQEIKKTIERWVMNSMKFKKMKVYEAKYNNEMFGDRLYKVRRSKGIERSDLGIQIAVKINPAQRIEAFENNRIQPRLDELVMLSNVLEVSLDYLIKGQQ